MVPGMTQYSQYQTSITKSEILAEHTAVVLPSTRCIEPLKMLAVYWLGTSILLTPQYYQYPTLEILSCVSRYRYGPIRAVPNLENTEILYCPVLAFEPLKELAVYRGVYQYTLTVGPQYSQLLTSIEP